jgi:hypothetical protein
MLYAWLVASCLPAHAAEKAETVVYANTFEARLGATFPEWSSSQIQYASRAQPQEAGFLPSQPITNVESPRPRVRRRFLGEFGGPRIDPKARTRVVQTIRLQVKDLPRHTHATVSFKLLILKSWDGNSPQFGPDRWMLTVAGGPKLIDTTFSNNPKVDSDKSDQDYPRRGSPPRTGAAAAGTLGYDFFGDSIYQLKFTFSHTADTLALDFASDLFEGKGTADESWGLDDVKITVTEATGSASTAERRNARH